MHLPCTRLISVLSCKSMEQQTAPSDIQSRAEDISDAVVHMAGLCFAVVAAPWLLFVTVRAHEDTWAITAVVIYGASLIMMILASAVYNGTRSDRWRPLFRRLDHSAIYLKIAASYTPLVAVSGGVGTGLLTALWAAALGGAGLKILSPDRLRWLGLTLYLGMGWAGLAAGQDLLAGMSPASQALVVIGGVLYTIGVPFFLWEGLRFQRAIWHGFVMVASVAIYAAILTEIAQGPRLASLGAVWVAPL